MKIRANAGRCDNRLMVEGQESVNLYAYLVKIQAK